MCIYVYVYLYVYVYVYVYVYIYIYFESNNIQNTYVKLITVQMLKNICFQCVPCNVNLKRSCPKNSYHLLQADYNLHRSLHPLIRNNSEYNSISERVQLNFNLFSFSACYETRTGRKPRLNKNPDRLLQNPDLIDIKTAFETGFTENFARQSAES